MHVKLFATEAAWMPSGPDTTRPLYGGVGQSGGTKFKCTCSQKNMPIVYSSVVIDIYYARQ